MVLKALANVTKNAFYAQWPLLLTKEVSLFTIMRQNARLAKTAADLVADMFRGAYNYMYIANNIDPAGAFRTLASQIGEIIDICFHRFFEVLQKGPKTDMSVWSKIVKAFSVFVKDVSFDSGKLKAGYLTRVIKWAKSCINESPADVLQVLRSLLWTSIENKEFAEAFDFIFDSFLRYLQSGAQDVSKISLQAFRRIAYAYPLECVARWGALGTAIAKPTVGPAAAFQILVRLAENQIEDINIWQEILTIHVPAAFKANNKNAIQMALQCIGQCGFIFSDLDEGIRRQCLATILGNDNDHAYESIGLLAGSSAPNFSATFLCDSYRKLINAEPPRLRPLSKVLKAFATEHKDQFDESWLENLLEVIYETQSPHQSKCLAFLLPFIKDEESREKILSTICDTLENGKEASTRWKAASALCEAAKFGYSNHTCAVNLYEALKDSKSPKLKVRAAEALAVIPTRAIIGDIYPQCVSISIEYLIDNAHFTFLKLDEQRKLDDEFRKALSTFFFRLLKWSSARDFDALEEALVSNAEQIFDMMCNYEDAPWESITTLYEKKFSSISTDLLEKFQNKAFLRE
jgi:hypothetical protein